MLARSILIALSAVSFTAVASATPIFSTDFEAPDYVLGDIVGQQGWDAIGFFEDDVVTANVQNSVVRNGSQAISLTGSGQGAGAFVYKTTPHEPRDETRITVDFDMQWGTGGSAKSFLYGLQTYDTNLDLVGSVGVSQFFGIYNAVVFDGDGNPVAIDGASITPGQWHHFQLVLDYQTQSYQAFVDGIGSPIMPFQTAGVTTYGEADFFRDAGLVDANDTAFFDSLSVNASVVPEPALLSSLAGLGLIARRRRA